MKTFIVIPAFNEEKVIGDVIRDLKQLYPNIIVVDDASDDATACVAEASGVIVLQHLINRGQGAALKTGVGYALQQGADSIVTFDADGQHQVADIEKLLQPIIDGQADVVLGSRFLDHSPTQGMPFFRKCILQLAVIFTQLTSHLHVTDTHNGLRAFSRSAAQKIKIHQDRMAHASEILDEIYRNKLRYKEVSVEIHYSSYSMSKGQSSMAFGKILLKYLLGRMMK